MTTKNDFTFMAMCSISAGKEHYHSMEVDQLKLQPCWPLHILASCGDSSSHACCAGYKASTHTGICYHLLQSNTDNLC
eukprot:4837496-Ditylum_brightwellii.AAC.1